MIMQGSIIVESILASAVSDADIVLEAVIEDVQVKNRLFKGDYAESFHNIMCTLQNAMEYACSYHLKLNWSVDIASLCSEETILCSNTLTLQLKDIFADIHKPEVVG